MSKIRVNDETFDFDFDHRPMSEALALEHAYKAAGEPMRYGQWEQEIAAGSAAAFCGLIWLVWRRDGREASLKDILSGETEVEFGAFLQSVYESAEEEQAAQQDPTNPGPARSVPDGTPGTRNATRSSSRKSSTSAPGKSVS